MKLSLKLFFLFFLCSAFFQPLYAQNGTLSSRDISGVSQLRLERYDNFLSREIENRRIAGARSLIYRKGAVVHDNVYGLKDIDENTPMMGDEIFYIQSMTKPIVSIAFMMLYEEGHFFLTDKVSAYLPYFYDLKVAVDPNAGAEGETVPVSREPTLADLLSHTAGFTHGLGSTKLEQDVFKALYYSPQENIESRVKTLVSLPLIGQPGEQWYYSASPDVLALLIEYFSGMSAAEFLEQRLFGPLGMEDTGYNLPTEKHHRVAALHAYDEEGKLIKAADQTPTQGNTVFGGTHGLFSTPNDYLKFCKMLLNEGELDGKRYLSPKTIELMTKNHLGDMAYTPGKGFGLGFGITSDPADSKSYGSEGDYFWSGAFCTYFFIDPEEELISILMTQTYPFTGFYGNKMRQFIYQAIID